MKKVLLFVQVLIALQVQGQYARIQEKNLHVFTNRTVNVTDELRELSKEFQAHPDFGIMPYQGPPDSRCIELLAKRDAYNRYFIKEGSKGTHFFKQQAYSPINYLDAAGQWREINYRLKPDVNVPGVFQASQQPTPFILDLNSRYSSVQLNGDKLKFNKDLQLMGTSKNPFLFSYNSLLVLIIHKLMTAEIIIRFS